MEVTRRVKLPTDKTTVIEALTAVMDANLLCDRCTEKTQTMPTMEQSDFCPVCQKTVFDHIALMVERRLQDRFGADKIRLEVD